MTNRYYNDNGRGALTNEASKPKSGSSHPTDMPIRSPNWPGLPGNHGPDRSGGTPRTGAMGPFYVHSEMSPKQTASGGKFGSLKNELASEPGVKNPGALAASIGRKKYGNAKMAQLSAKGRKG